MKSPTTAPVRRAPQDPATSALFAENVVDDVDPPAQEAPEPEPEHHRSALRRSAERNVGG